ncbi:Uma2 family endonuclease [Streptomyces millisiae]|uniref:Uma2 family endonuclease n=1 Tax=Streptomyces millisiae TaxID=3075542 RepID=A0ABU2M0U8_9ACTN|nr:Uma2 family endonuclease [Streptomyces sp. DSM 44918]MDT0323468.1 Uma2 family endonuclease [Streptomyces sp. DSM 44918]
MSVATVEYHCDGRPDVSWDELLGVLDEFDTPDGFKAEIIEGVITLAPPPSNGHTYIATELHEALVLAKLPKGLGVIQNLGVVTPRREGYYIPDLVVAKKALMISPEKIQAADVELVVEITSPSNARHDRLAKRVGYAVAGVPLYLLVDAFADGGPTVTLYGEPNGEMYRVLQAGKFGDTFHLPEPFDLDLDTAGWHVG